MKNITFFLNLAMVAVLTGCVHTWRTETTTGTRYGYTLATNRDGTVTSVLTSKVDFKDRDSGVALTVLSDPKAAQILVNHTNQTALGGGSRFSVGQIGWQTSSNAGQVVDAVGGAAGTIIGDAAKAAVK